MADQQYVPMREREGSGGRGKEAAFPEREGIPQLQHAHSAEIEYRLPERRVCVCVCVCMCACVVSHLNISLRNAVSLLSTASRVSPPVGVYSLTLT